MFASGMQTSVPLRSSDSSPISIEPYEQVSKEVGAIKAC